MVVVYEDESVRVILGTSNLLGDDWQNRSQGLWVSPRCPRGSGDSATHFKRDLVNYLECYELGAALRPFIDSIQNCDMSEINAFFLASVPGSHDISDTDAGQAAADGGPIYGQIGLEYLLRKHADVSIKDWPVTLQCSSIGSLGKTPDGSFLEELGITLNACHGRIGAHKPTKINFVYPTIDNVINGYGGPVYSSGCLPYVRSTHEKQPWLEDFMYVWKADNVHRTRAIPHIKSYAKIRENEAGYFVLTSSNLSKAAWGGYNKGRTKLFIKSHEAGILLLPKFTHTKWGKATYNLNEDITLPFDWPLTKYQVGTDKPFFHEA